MRFSEFFVIHHSDRKVLTFLLALATILVVLIYLTGNDGGETVLTAADSLAAEEQPGYGKGRQAPPYRAYQTQDGRQIELAPFDPNTADSTQLLRIGLQPWQDRAVYKYRAKGGVFRTPHDFGRLYGMTRKQYEELEPYICIGDDYQPAYTQFASREEEARERYEAYKASDQYVPYQKHRALSCKAATWRTGRFGHRRHLASKEDSRHRSGLGTTHRQLPQPPGWLLQRQPATRP